MYRVLRVGLVEDGPVKKATWGRSLRGIDTGWAALEKAQRSPDVRLMWLGQLLEVVVADWVCQGGFRSPWLVGLETAGTF